MTKDGPLTERQIKVLSQLPEIRGWYWVQNTKTGYERPVLIDRPAVTSRNCGAYLIKCWSVWNGSDNSISITEDWLRENVVLGYIEPFKHPTLPENFGMF